MPITINGSGTLTGISAGGLPDATITQPELAANVAGNGPAFSAYASSSQILSNGAFTKVQINTEEFDTNNNFDSVTNYRFTPTVAGYYNINGCINITNIASTRNVVAIYKNGSEYKRGLDLGGITPSTIGASISSIVYFNGTTDYVELYGYVANTGSNTTVSGTVLTWFNGAMVRAA